MKFARSKWRGEESRSTKLFFAGPHLLPATLDKTTLNRATSSLELFPTAVYHGIIISGPRGDAHINRGNYSAPLIP